MEAEAAGANEDAVEFDDADFGTIIDQLAVSLGGIGPISGVGEGVELCLARLAGNFAEEDVVIVVGIEPRKLSGRAAGPDKRGQRWREKASGRAAT